ncbi:MAG: hypothetical protein AVDCRST_MAG38-591 [uncultured Solirubrobacteraceae bacterium]|uniref:Methyltransferase domain-containing protein n=1 Tax=uncultured Solirubrobacteraceae bacterium TaxID=1162706 RepID=A0A6J4RFQ3_9ACTN|nr:MAG: hypothetical protein AVDCRST_MAG38-591 [uncultured Solirubrobacteraceae bacterium]
MTPDRPPSATPTWFPDEQAHAGRENLDAAHVARYDAKMDAEAAREVALLREHGLTERSLVVELGAGTGQFAVEVARACERVIAVDVSAPMLDRLRGKAVSRGLNNLTVAQAGFLTYQHAERPADFVYSRFALHHLPDFWKAIALERIRGMVRPGAIVRLWDVVYHFPAAEAAERIEAWCATGGDEVEGEWSRAELEEHVRDEHSTFSWILEPMIERGGFDIVEAEHSEDGMSAQYLLRAM